MKFVSCVTNIFEYYNWSYNRYLLKQTKLSHVQDVNSDLNCSTNKATDIFVYEFLHLFWIVESIIQKYPTNTSHEYINETSCIHMLLYFIIR